MYGARPPGLADDPRFASNAKRSRTRELVPHAGDILRQRTVDEWLETLRAAEVPAAPVNNLEGAFAEPPVAEREMIVEYDHPEVGRVRMPGNPIKMSMASANDFKTGAAAGRAYRCGVSRVASLPATVSRDCVSRASFNKCLKSNT